VVRLMGQQGVFLVKQAVFASAQCPLPDHGTKYGREACAHDLGYLAGTEPRFDHLHEHFHMLELI
jgi:hypothetical protein